MNWSRLLYKGRACFYIMLGKGKPSFSQFGEDRILEYLFHIKGIKNPTYLDIGANDPHLGSNTYLFYNRGCRGVLIEPDPELVRTLKRKRNHDTIIPFGIGLGNQKEATFYKYSRAFSGWNTFSKEEADIRIAEGHPYSETLQIPLLHINAILEQHFPVSPPDLVSIDVEGLDFDIIKSIDFSKHKPLALVVETLRFGDTQKAVKDAEIEKYILSHGYKVFADTYANTIFMREA